MRVFKFHESSPGHVMAKPADVDNDSPLLKQMLKSIDAEQKTENNPRLFPDGKKASADKTSINLPSKLSANNKATPTIRAQSQVTNKTVRAVKAAKAKLKAKVHLPLSSQNN